MLLFVSRHGSVQYAQYDITSGQEVYIGLKVSVDHPKRRGYCPSLYVLHLINERIAQ